MAGEDDGDPGLSELSQNLGHVLDPQRIEPGERLIQDQELGIVDQCGRELDPLLISV